MTGAQFEILVDGKPQSDSDLKDVAIASAELVMSHNPLSEVAVRDTKTGEITQVSYSQASADGAHDAPVRSRLRDRRGRQDYTVYSGGWEAWKAWAKMK